MQRDAAREDRPGGGELIVGTEAGERLDRVLQERLPDLSRAAVQRLIEQGAATVGGRPARAGQRLRAGERVQWSEPAQPPAGGPAPEAIPLSIAFEDESVLVLNKPRGLVVHPAPGHATGTLVNALLAHTGDELDGVGAADRPGLVHRLDRDTTGLMVVARSEVALRSLQEQIAARTMERRYLALAFGSPRWERAAVDAPIGRHPTDRRRMGVIAPGSRHTHREARTDLRVLARFTGMVLLEARLHTGRTHQVRVHAAYTGLPIAGDPLYGPRRTGGERILPAAVREALHGLGGQALHAYRLAFDHPRSGERLLFRAPPPEDFQALLESLGHAGAPEEEPWPDA